MTGFPLLMPAAGIIVALLGAAVLLHAQRNRKPAWPGVLGILLGALLILLSLFRPTSSAPLPVTESVPPGEQRPEKPPVRPETPPLPPRKPESGPPPSQPEPGSEIKQEPSRPQPELPAPPVKPETPKTPEVPKTPEKPALPEPSAPPVKSETPTPPATAGSVPHREEKPANATSLPATQTPANATTLPATLKPANTTSLPATLVPR